MPSKSAVAVSSVGGSPGTQLAVDLDQRLFRLAHGVAAQRVGDDVAHVVALGEEDLEAGDAARDDLVQAVGGELTLASTITSPVVMIDDVGSGHRAIEFGGLDFDLVDLGVREVPSAMMAVTLRPECAISSPLMQDGVCRLRSQQMRELSWSRTTFQLQLAVLRRECVSTV